MTDAQLAAEREAFDRWFWASRETTPVVQQSDGTCQFREANIALEAWLARAELDRRPPLMTIPEPLPVKWPLVENTGRELNPADSQPPPPEPPQTD